MEDSALSVVWTTIYTVQSSWEGVWRRGLQVINMKSKLKVNSQFPPRHLHSDKVFIRGNEQNMKETKVATVKLGQIKSHFLPL